MKTKRDLVQEMVSIFIQQDALNEQLKEIKAEAKELEFDPAVLSKVAKSIADGKVNELAEKSEVILETIEEVQ